MKSEFPEQARIFRSLGLDTEGDFLCRKVSGLIMMRHEAEVVNTPVFTDRLTAVQVMRLPGVITTVKTVLRANPKGRGMEIDWRGERHAIRCTGCNKVYDEADAQHVKKADDGRVLCVKHGDRTEPVLVECTVRTRNQRVSATHLRQDGEEMTLSSRLNRGETVEALPASNARYAPLVYDGTMNGVPLPTQLLVTFMRPDGSLAAYVLPADLVDARARGYYADAEEDELAPVMFYRTPHEMWKDGHQVSTFRPKAHDATGKPIDLKEPIPAGLMGEHKVRLTERLDRYDAVLVNLAAKAEERPRAILKTVDPDSVVYDGVQRDVYGEIDRLPEVRNGSRNMSAASLAKLRDLTLPRFDPEGVRKGDDRSYLQDRHAILGACFEKAIANAAKREEERAKRKAEEAAEEAIGQMIDELPEPKANES